MNTILYWPFDIHDTFLMSGHDLNDIWVEDWAPFKYWLEGLTNLTQISVSQIKNIPTFRAMYVGEIIRL